jgi:hypothetical protein
LAKRPFANFRRHIFNGRPPAKKLLVNMTFAEGFIRASKIFHHRFSAGTDVQFGVNPARVFAHSVQADAHLGRHFLVTKSIGQQLQRATTIFGPWVLMTNIVMSPLGYVSYDDQNPIVPAAFYRLSRP